jgi:lipopolysaccharide transport system permease protein
VRRVDVRMTTTPSDYPVTTIKPAERRLMPEFRELWRHRHLALLFAWRDVKVRYKQSLIGIAWAVLQPFITMVVFTLIFGKFANFPSQGLPYQVFVYAGLIPWTFFASSLGLTAGSVVTNRVLVQKVYFPRLVLPLSSVLVPLVDFFFSFLVLLGIMLWFDVSIQATAILAPLFLLIIAMTAVGVGSALAVVNVRYRDVPYTIPFLIQLWLYASPVIYPTNALPEQYQIISALNPVVAGVTGFRWALTGTPPPDTIVLVLGISMAIVLFVGGLLVYRRGEAKFADVM